jgi:hypothetical protein
MSRRFGLIGLLCLACWASSVNFVAAQADKLVRVTYPVADLVVPIENHLFKDADKSRQEPTPTREAMAERLIRTITQTVARESWASAGGRGGIQFFPLGMALVVEQRADVQEQVAKLLAELRSLQDVQVAVELRLVLCGKQGAKALWQNLEAHGQPTRVFQRTSSLDRNGDARPIRSLDDKQVRAALEQIQADRAAHIVQAPKMTLFNAQQATISSAERDGKGALRDGMQCDVWPVVDADRKSVRLAFNLEMVVPGNPKTHRPTVKAAATFAVAPDTTIVWPLGDAGKGRQLVVLATPRLIIETEEPRVFAAEPKPAVVAPAGATEEQAVPEPKKEDKQSAIQRRLRQPISLNFKNVPLNQAVKDISAASGVSVVLDMRSMQDAKINLDAPISISVNNIDMKSALNLLLDQSRTTFVIQNDALVITTEDRGCYQIRRTYPIADLLTPMALTDGKGKKVDELAESIRELIQNTVLKNSWEGMGGRGTILYSPPEKTLGVTQCQEVHEEIAELLASLRRLYGVTVRADVCFVHASADVAQRMRKEMLTEGMKVDSRRSLPQKKPRDFVNDTGAPAPEIDKAAYRNGAVPFVAMPECRVVQLLDMAESDRVGCVVKAPRVTFLDGQQIPLELTRRKAVTAEFRVPRERVLLPAPYAKPEDEVYESQHDQNVSKWRCEIQPVVSVDRKQVRLSVNLEHAAKDFATAMENAVKTSRTFNIPDGKTLVWDLGSSAGEHLFVLITPRIQVREEPKEKIFQGTLEPIPGR